MVKEDKENPALGKKDGELEKFKKMQNLDEKIDENLEEGEAYYKVGNYSVAFFMYFKAIEGMAISIMKEKLDKDIEIERDEAFEYLVKKNVAGITEEEVDKFEENFDFFIGRKEVDKEVVKEIKGTAEKLKDEVDKR